MDRERFDALTKSLVSRRTGLGFGFAALLGLAPAPDAGAKKKPCPACKKRVKGKCKPKPNGSPCGTGKTCQNGVCKNAPPPPPPTCTDGIKNGAETGVDCGGPDCPRCPNGQACADRGDCASARCTNGLCAACGADADCGSGCGCRNSVCTEHTPGIVISCDECPPNTAVCLDLAMRMCYLFCGT